MPWNLGKTRRPRNDIARNNPHANDRRQVPNKHSRNVCLHREAQRRTASQRSDSTESRGRDVREALQKDVFACFAFFARPKVLRRTAPQNICSVSTALSQFFIVV